MEILMRFYAPALLVMAISILPLTALAGTVVGKMNCPQSLPCNQSDPEFPPVSRVIDMANSCVAGGAGMSFEGGYFDQTAGIDSSGCLASRPEVAQANGPGVHSIPQCCIQQGNQPGRCIIHCEFVVP